MAAGAARGPRVQRATRKALDDQLRRNPHRIGDAQRAALRAGALAVDIAIASRQSEAITRANRGYLEQLREAGLIAGDRRPDGGGPVGGAASSAADDEFLEIVRGLTGAAVGDVADSGASDDGPGVGAGR